MPMKYSKTTETVRNHTILGEFSGECADATIMNENDMFIERPVWEYLFNSDEYKRGIELGHYIGFLGHPDDPGCQDFEHACIVMTSGWIEPDGKVKGTFNLIDTPVGRIVKAFIDSGVKFGISVRGAGDVVNQHVVPEQFIFRGFDLVTFPAYPDSIPVFKEIAASVDITKKQKYENVVSTIKANINFVTSTEAIDQMKMNFDQNSDVAHILDDRERRLQAVHDVDLDVEMLQHKLDAMTSMFMAKSMECQRLMEALEAAEAIIRRTRGQNAAAVNSIRRISEDQQRVLSSENKKLRGYIAASDKTINKLNAKNADLIASKKVTIQANKDLQAEVSRLQSEADELHDQVEQYQGDIHRSQIKASRAIKAHKNTQSTLDSVKTSNLKYQTKLEDYESTIEEQRQQIADLTQQLSETVRDQKRIEKQASNRDDKVSSLQTKLDDAYEIIGQYQDAYASLYGSAVGVDPSGLNVSLNCSVSELQSAITRNTVDATTEEPQLEELESDFNADLVTL